jgi:hypothetical protein
MHRLVAVKFHDKCSHKRASCARTFFIAAAFLSFLAFAAGGFTMALRAFSATFAVLRWRSALS